MLLPLIHHSFIQHLIQHAGRNRRVYAALDNETPKQIADKFGVMLKQVLLDNKRLHPGLRTLRTLLLLLQRSTMTLLESVASQLPSFFCFC